MVTKYLKVGALAALQIVIVCSLQILPANAIYGLSLPFLYLLAFCGFFIPCALMTARLAVRYPQTGGAYIWAEQAFGANVGFFTMAILWIANLLWYPSVFALISANLAYLFDPSLAESKSFIISTSVILYWLVTGLNCLGVQISTRASVICSVVGIIMPMLLIIGSAFVWWYTGNPIALSLEKTPLIPQLGEGANLGYLVAIVISLFGIEVAAVHSGDVVNPKRNFPLSLMISSVVILLLLLGAELAIGTIIPTDQLSVMTGLLDALTTFFQTTQLQALIFPVLLLVLLGNIGSTTAWMLGGTRGMLIACQHNQMGKFLQKTNQREAPVGILVFEALIFTCASALFLFFPKVSDTFWLLLDLASAINLIYYVILFVACMRLLSFKISMLAGILSCIVAFAFALIPPPDLDPSAHLLFHLTMGSGLIFACSFPLIFLKASKRAH